MHQCALGTLGAAGSGDGAPGALRTLLAEIDRAGSGGTDLICSVWSLRRFHPE